MSAPTITPTKYFIVDDAMEVEAILLDGTPEQLEQLRTDHWTDDQVRLLHYPTAPTVGFLGDMPPLSGFGQVLTEGLYLAKGPAGDFKLFAAEKFEAGAVEVIV